MPKSRRTDSSILLSEPYWSILSADFLHEEALYFPGLSCKKKIIITTPIAPAIKEPTKPACHPSQPTTDPTNIKDKNSPKL